MNPLTLQWEQIVRELGPKLYRYFAGQFAPQQAADLVQETFIRLVRKVREGEFQPELGEIGAYAFGIARWVRIESSRATRRLAYTEAFDDVAAPFEGDSSDRVAHLRWAIGQLKPVEQEVILRVIDEDCGLEQIAGDLQMPLGTVKSHLHRAKIKLKELLEERV